MNGLIKPKPVLNPVKPKKVIDMTYANTFDHIDTQNPSARTVLVEQSQQQKLLNDRPRMPEIFKNRQLPEQNSPETFGGSHHNTYEASSQAGGHQSRNSRFSRTSSQKPILRKEFQLYEDQLESYDERLNTQFDSDYRSKQDFILKNVYSSQSLKP